MATDVVPVLNEDSDFLSWEHDEGQKNPSISNRIRDGTATFMIVNYGETWRESLRAL